MGFEDSYVLMKNPLFTFSAHRLFANKVMFVVKIVFISILIVHIFLCD